MKPEPETLNIADNKTRDGNFKMQVSYVSKPERQLNLFIISVKYFFSIYKHLFEREKPNSDRVFLSHL